MLLVCCSFLYVHSSSMNETSSIHIDSKITLSMYDKWVGKGEKNSTANMERFYWSGLGKINILLSTFHRLDQSMTTLSCVTCHEMGLTLSPGEGFGCCWLKLGYVPTKLQIRLCFYKAEGRSKPPCLKNLPPLNKDKWILTSQLPAHLPAPNAIP